MMACDCKSTRLTWTQDGGMTMLNGRNGIDESNASWEYCKEF